MKKNVLLLSGRSLATVAVSLLLWSSPLLAAGSAPSRIALQGEPFSGLERQEPLLASLLHTVVQEDADHQRFLPLEPYFSGMLSGLQGSFKFHGTFQPRPDGSVGFMFDLDSTRDRSNITYSGVIDPSATVIVYTRVSRDSPADRGQVEKAQWPAADGR